MYDKYQKYNTQINVYVQSLYLKNTQVHRQNEIDDYFNDNYIIKVEHVNIIIKNFSLFLKIQYIIYNIKQLSYD